MNRVASRTRTAAADSVAAVKSTTAKTLDPIRREISEYATAIDAKSAPAEPGRSFAVRIFFLRVRS